MTVYIAFYKGRAKKRKDRLIDSIIRLATKGEYSHTEIAVERSDGLFDCYSSSLRDGGVRMKTMPLPQEKWTLLKVNKTEAQVKTYFEKTKHQLYDLCGAIASTIPFVQSVESQFCSEWCYNFLFNSKYGWRFSPNTLYCLLRSLLTMKDEYIFI